MDKGVDDVVQGGSGLACRLRGRERGVLQCVTGGDLIVELSLLLCLQVVTDINAISVRLPIPQNHLFLSLVQTSVNTNAPVVVDCDVLLMRCAKWGL